MNRDKLWTTRDGRQIAIKDMGTQHLKNTLAMLHRNGYVEIEKVMSYLCGNPFDSDSMAYYAFDQEADVLLSKKTTPIMGWIEDELALREKGEQK